MPQIIIHQKDLPDIARTYGKVYETNIGQVSYTKLVDPKGFVLLSKDDQLRFYLFKKPKGIWEMVWGASSIVKEGLPMSEGLMQWKIQHALRAGKQGLSDAEALSRAELDSAAEVGTDVHKAGEELLKGNEVNLAGRSSREVELIISIANFINDHKLRNSKTEMIVAYDNVIDGVRIIYAGTTDWVVEIYNEVAKKWETWLIDFKTSSDAHPSHKLQSLGYAEAVHQSYGIKIDRIGILLLGRKTRSGYTLVEVGRERKYKLSFADFVLTYRMALLINGGALPSPSYKTYPTTIKLIQEKEVRDVDSNNNPSSDTSASSGADDQRPAGRKKSSAGMGSTPAPKVPAGHSPVKAVPANYSIRAQAGSTVGRRYAHRRAYAAR
jgi:hypothetical protein